jgi:hypothetical protein
VNIGRYSAAAGALKHDRGALKFEIILCNSTPVTMQDLCRIKEI